MMDNQKLFPLTCKHFEVESVRLWQQFKTELEIEDEQKAISYWPLFLRKAKVPLSMIELAYFESACLQAKSASDQTHRMDGLCLNPSAQVIPIDRAADLLGRRRGVYVIYTYEQQLKVEAMTLPEALCFEHIQEDRAFTVEQFEQWMQIEFAEEGLDANPKPIIKKMLDEGIFRQSQADFV